MGVVTRNKKRGFTGGGGGSSTWTPGQKRYRISRKGPTKSCQVAFRLTFRVTASCTRTHDSEMHRIPCVAGTIRGADARRPFLFFSFLFCFFAGVVFRAYSVGQGPEGMKGTRSLDTAVSISFYANFRATKMRRTSRVGLDRSVFH